jgi:hypothetical protein
MFCRLWFVLFYVPIISDVLIGYTSSNYLFGIVQLLSVVRIAGSFVWYSEESFVDDNLSFFYCSHYTFVLRYTSYNYIFGIFQLLSMVRVAQYLVFCVVLYEPLFFLNSNELSWFWTNQSFILHLNDIYFVEKGEILIA